MAIFDKHSHKRVSWHHHASTSSKLRAALFHLELNYSTFVSRQWVWTSSFSFHPPPPPHLQLLSLPAQTALRSRPRAGALSNADSSQTRYCTELPEGLIIRDSRLQREGSAKQSRIRLEIPELVQLLMLSSAAAEKVKGILYVMSQPLPLATLCFYLTALKHKCLCRRFVPYQRWSSEQLKVKVWPGPQQVCIM